MSPFVLVVFTVFSSVTVEAIDMPSRAVCERALATLQARNSVVFRHSFCLDRREALDAR